MAFRRFPTMGSSFSSGFPRGSHMVSRDCHLSLSTLSPYLFNRPQTPIITRIISSSCTRCPPDPRELDCCEICVRKSSGFVYSLAHKLIVGCSPFSWIDTSPSKTTATWNGHSPILEVSRTRDEARLGGDGWPGPLCRAKTRFHPIRRLERDPLSTSWTPFAFVGGPFAFLLSSKNTFRSSIDDTHPAMRGGITTFGQWLTLPSIPGPLDRVGSSTEDP
jgi:hypothetical protein